MVVVFGASCSSSYLVTTVLVSGSPRRLPRRHPRPHGARAGDDGAARRQELAGPPRRLDRIIPDVQVEGHADDAAPIDDEPDSLSASPNSSAPTDPPNPQPHPSGTGSWGPDPKIRCQKRGTTALHCSAHPALVAQLDRASDYGSEGWGFESLQARAELGCQRPRGDRRPGPRDTAAPLCPWPGSRRSST